MTHSADPQDADFEINQAALTYHAEPRPGKISVEVTKPAETARDLSLAYTPGVAEPVRRIAENPEDAYRYTAKGNLVAVITDGTAVLGLGRVGALAGKPVMEGKGVLFKHFADIDVFDIEVQAETPQEFIDTVRRIAPTFGGINLEDIAAPHCFEIEQALIEQLDIPVFHDDQHGTAIIIAAGLLNALELQGKSLGEARMVVLGAGAAGIAAVRLLIAMGAHRNNILVVDRKGVIHTGREDLNPYKFGVAAETDRRTLEDAMEGADVFIGVSGPDLVTRGMLASMAERPVVFALSNPVPEIRPEIAREVRDDLVMATGRSDYPNQVNNVLGFPFIFRGALDVRASRINEAMQIAAAQALRELTHEPVPQAVLDAYDLDSLAFGPDYILPKPFDPRLREVVPPAVARAAIETGVARGDWPAYYPAL
ncbi:malic enzyme-like NAD(P)-binding protein [endosymbiont of unidentified scaly snail isolate Monju]|uniref:malic enzyme-like NAD(P)-binding protein n=1 Tax=endosymbiont of unidentified scaly snail isolate Monju TaxID=1248727 RepID=UPI00038925AB|nr:malic enzyme-like NAD(P)-binding protein [endosymbiont of unidentified scaly snail isolate Monju]BAN70203.1 malate dehydrogenase (oxaloacetate-decarboxylating)(NADP+) [endosymbiont of unidentified scaly snail isolate Monju]